MAATEWKQSREGPANNIKLCRQEKNWSTEVTQNKQNLQAGCAKSTWFPKCKHDKGCTALACCPRPRLHLPWKNQVQEEGQHIFSNGTYAYLDSIFLVRYEVDACLHPGISTFSQHLFLQSVDIWSIKCDLLGRYSGPVSLTSGDTFDILHNHW